MKCIQAGRGGDFSRRLAGSMAGAAEAHPVVVVTGARQTGKSTLLKRERPFASWKYITLDDFEALGLAEKDPGALWAGVDRVVLDEVQKSPAVLSAVKRAVDEKKCRFALSGSANLLLMRRVSESLAGRAVHFTLPPMTWGEMRGEKESGLLEGLFAGRWPRERSVSVEAPERAILGGFMPAFILTRSPTDRLRWWEGYVATYLERDLRQLSQVDSLTDFRRVMELLALRSGQLLNQTAVAAESSVSQPSVHRYANLLEASHLIERLPGFAGNRSKRLVKAPKLHWMDPALAAFLSGLHDEKALRSSREFGGLFETLVHLHVRAACERMTPKPRICHWRTAAGEKVDFVLEHGRKLVAVEAKAGAEARQGDAEGLRAFLAAHPAAVAGVLAYGGGFVKRLSEKIVAVPWSLLE